LDSGESEQQEPIINNKMQENITVTLRYGLTNTVTRSFPEDTTVSDVLSDRSILAALSAPEAVSAVANGVTLDGSNNLHGLGTITLEQQASSKA
jgi:hypothetical protein